MNGISIRGLKKVYRLGRVVVPALNGVNLDIPPSELVGVVGPSGSGKSTLLNIVGCIDKPDDGMVEIDGKDVVPLYDDDRTELRRSNIGFIFQSFNLIPVLDARENIELPLVALGVPVTERRRRVAEVLEHVGLSGLERRRPDELSGGQRQRVAIARAIVIRPKIVLADEPTANLDRETGRMIVELMRTMNRNSGATFILATHDPRVLPFMDRIVQLEDGRVTDVTAPGKIEKP